MESTKNEAPSGAAPGSEAGAGGDGKPLGDEFRRLADAVGSEFGHDAGKGGGGRGGRGPGATRKRRGADAGADAGASEGDDLDAEKSSTDPSPDFELPAELLEAVGIEAAEALDQRRVSRVTAAAVEFGIPLDAARPVIESVAMPQKRKELIGRLTPYAIREWGIGKVASPTGAILILVSVSELSAFRAIAAFREDAAARRRAESGNAN